MLSRRDFIRGANGIALTIPFLGLIGCDDTSADGAHSISGKTMGTTYNVKVARASDAVDGEGLASRIQASLDRVESLMSTYRPTSELSLFNADVAGSSRSVTTDTARVIETALAVADMTDGAFDPTVGPLVDLWGFGPNGGRADLPADAEITTAMADMGYHNISIANQELAKTTQARLDLSGIAKGFGVDKVAELLEAEGIEHYLVEVGGEVRTRGLSPEDRAWRLGIEKPNPASRDIQRIVGLSGQALASSGNYRIFFEADRQRYAHIIDPRSGRPLTHDLASATVIAKTTMQADALSTAMLVMGTGSAMAFARDHDIAAFLISGRDGSFTDAASPAFERLFSA
ncbi:FAD:protein FMN transferase [Sedimentitalea todarodis]|uniref:FAD:protein FMN transferase n=1 Tax=Sedimentitalea todarodis TaxID=1631240 RepID=A0ABU3VI51_9RHOB|nr:FAD:protein FMN transferase [Sedimentitalea todarodis]MDU9005369.1 FAD:protein FMN transferase [Sedimentitalea todarodis]